MEKKIEALMELIEIVERLRAPGGCPWDQQQTLNDMGRYLMEEVSEVVDAIDTSEGSPSAAVCEELGDSLMNIFLAARIAEESGGFSLSEVARQISEKLIRRHPHVFGDVEVSGVDEVLTNWEAIKATESKGSADGVDSKRSRLDGVPRSLPTLQRAFELGRKAAKAGFDWPDAHGAFEKVNEELDELGELLGNHPNGATEPAGKARLEDEAGDLLFAAVSLCRKLDIRPDAALRRTLRKFDRRFRAIERRFSDLEQRSLEELESAWQSAKLDEAAD